MTKIPKELKEQKVYGQGIYLKYLTEAQTGGFSNVNDWITSLIAKIEHLEQNIKSLQSEIAKKG